MAHELASVLRHGTRVVFGDLFLIQEWNTSITPINISLNYEDFEIILRNLYPEQTNIVNFIDSTSRFGTLMAFDNPTQDRDGFRSMGIRLRVDVSQPLQFGYYAPNNRYEVNRVIMRYQELPRLFCNLCNRLGHTNEDCLDNFLLNHPSMQAPDHFDDLPEHIPFPEDPFAQAAYDQEALHNIDRDDPDSDRSLEVHYSQVNTSREQSVVSYTDGEGPAEGYYQVGFRSDISTDSERTISEWKVIENSTSGSPSPSVPDNQIVPATSDASPAQFVTSDIEYDMLSELVSDLASDSDTSSPTSTLNGVGSKCLNPEQQLYLMSIEHGSSSTTSNFRGVSQEGYDQWTTQYQPPKWPRIEDVTESTAAQDQQQQHHPQPTDLSPFTDQN